MHTSVNTIQINPIMKTKIPIRDSFARQHSISLLIFSLSHSKIHAIISESIDSPSESAIIARYSHSPYSKHFACTTTFWFLANNDATLSFAYEALDENKMFVVTKILLNHQHGLLLTLHIVARNLHHTNGDKQISSTWYTKLLYVNVISTKYS